MFIIIAITYILNINVQLRTLKTNYDCFTGKKTATEVMAASNDENSKSFLGKQDSFYESSNKRDSLSVEKKNTIIEKVESVRNYF